MLQIKSKLSTSAICLMFPIFMAFLPERKNNNNIKIIKIISFPYNRNVRSKFVFALQNEILI